MKRWLQFILLLLAVPAFGYAPEPRQLLSAHAYEPNSALRLNENLDYTYDASHNLASRTANTLTQAFSSDAANELASITRSGTLTVSGSITGAVAALGVNGQPAVIYSDGTFATTSGLTLRDGNNMFVTTGSNSSGALVLSTITSNRLPVTVNFAYDLNGNMLADGQRVLEYDDANRLTAVTASNLYRTEFVYDGLSRRRIVRDYNWSSGNWQLASQIGYICDGYLPMQERDASGNVLVTYTCGPDLSGTFGGAGGIGGLLARTDSSGSAFYHADVAGNITSLTDSSGGAVARYLNDPFGKLTGKWGPVADVCAIGYSSMPKVGQSGLVGYPSRFYDPTLQRWLNPDPMGEFGGINRYGFNFNNPLSYIDPDGMAPQLVTVTGSLSGGPAGAGYVDYHQGENYGIGLHGPLDLGDSPPGRLLDLLGRIQKPIDDAEQWLKDSGNPFVRGLGGLLAGVQWAFPEGKGARARKACKLERYGSTAEAETSEVANMLLPRPGHERQPKWVGLEGTIDPRTLGKPQNYTDKMEIYMKEDVGDWLRQNAILKNNEPGRYGIPADKLDEFNKMIDSINSSKR